jgi:hypothetical protein
MHDPLLPSFPAVSVPGEPDPADAVPAPANRAARRGRAGKKTPSGAVHADSSGHARAAQGRRINPVRRTG